MCIAFDGAYILEAPPADPAGTDEDQDHATEWTLRRRLEEIQSLDKVIRLPGNGT
jgi:hypothetical protein